MAEVINSWAQVDGGVRYEVEVDDFTVTVDDDGDGHLSGFIRGETPANEDKVLARAFETVRELDED